MPFSWTVISLVGYMTAMYLIITDTCMYKHELASHGTECPRISTRKCLGICCRSGQVDPAEACDALSGMQWCVSKLSPLRL